MVKTHRFAILLLALMMLTGGVVSAEDAARDVAPTATVTASSTLSDKYEPNCVIDGKLPLAGGKDEARQCWIANGKDLANGGVTLAFAWDQPTTVASVVCYARTAFGLKDCFKDYEVYVDDGTEPVAKGALLAGHGAQVVDLPAPVQVRTLTLKLLSAHGEGNPGISEVQIFSAKPAQSQLLARFNDYAQDFRFTYFPSHNLVRFLLPKPPADARTWRVEVLPAKGGEPLARREGTLPMSPVGENLSVPNLPEGDYRVVLTLSGSDKPVIDERWFSRRHFEWEGNKLGLDDVVILPFTPLAVDQAKGTVDCVLRTHTMSPAGLWEQVKSDGEDILAGPVRLEVVSGGKTAVAQGKGLKFDLAKDTRVTGSAEWSAGNLSGSTSFDYDYDGFTQLTLKLAKAAEPIERVQLVIPMKAKYAWLLHPVTAMLRQHYAGRVPAGEGKVWDTSGVPSRIGGYFVPYLFLGGTERGLCFAADNDRDWVRGDGVPMMEIDRQGETVNLRLNLVSGPARLDRDRAITFALQATPAKPMPEEPYTWRKWWATGTARDAKDVYINFWGGNGYWGGRNFASSVFPDRKDFGYWDKLAEQRRTGKLDKEYMDQWFARYASLPEKQRSQIEPAMRAGFQWSSHTPANTPETTKFNYLIPYTNPRGASVGEDLDFRTTYIDEWQTIGIADPVWARASDFEHPTRLKGWATWYHIEPVPSRQDMLLYYHRKMFETFADGIYWDNYFLRPSYIPSPAGPAYVADDGTLRPGVNLNAFRALTRRTAVMMHAMGKRPLIYVHMTNTNIIPMLSFATLNLDWEWRDQGEWAKKDLQDRLGSDKDTALILAQSLGFQSGNISVAIDRFHPPKDSGITREWLFRTVLAVCLPHEIKIYQGTKDVSFVHRHLADFGYGESDCKVLRYWDEGYPLKATGAKTYALVLARDGRAMLAVGNFGAGEANPDGGVPQQGDAPSLEDYDAAQRGLKKPSDSTQASTAPATGEAYTVTLTVDLKALGLGEDVRAYDVEQRARNAAAAAKAKKAKQDPPEMPDPELKRIAPGTFVLPIRKHDFALIAVE